MSFFSEGRASNAVPGQFKCAVDGRWLPSTKFSRNQITKWQKAKNHPDDGVTPDNIALVCKDHTKKMQKPREMKCRGPCSSWKEMENFSKAQRNDPDAWCISCTNWKINIGGEEIPDAPPGSTMMTLQDIQDPVAQDQPSGISTESYALDSQAAQSTMDLQSGGSSMGFNPGHPWANLDHINVDVSAPSPRKILRNVNRYDDTMPNDRDTADGISTTDFDSRITSNTGDNASSASALNTRDSRIVNGENGGPVEDGWGEGDFAALDVPSNGPSYMAVSRSKTSKNERFPKSDNRKKFFAAPAYEPQPPATYDSDLDSDSDSD